MVTADVEKQEANLMTVDEVERQHCLELYMWRIDVYIAIISGRAYIFFLYKTRV